MKFKIISVFFLNFKGFRIRISLLKLLCWDISDGATALMSLGRLYGKLLVVRTFIDSHQSPEKKKQIKSTRSSYSEKENRNDNTTTNKRNVRWKQKYIYSYCCCFISLEILHRASVCICMYVSMVIFFILFSDIINSGALKTLSLSSILLWFELV